MIRSLPARRMASRFSRTMAASSTRPACGGVLDQRVLARDVVADHRAQDLVAHPADDVQVGQRRLDHDHVGALLQVQQGLEHGLAAVARVHLVGLAVALGRAVAGVAEGAVVGAGVLGAVGQDRRVGEAVARPAGSRMAPTRPSIMSLGLTMSAPAWAWFRAILASCSTLASLTTSPSSRKPQWPWLV